MKYGSVKTTHIMDDNGSALIEIIKYRHEEVDRTMRQYKIRVHVKNAQEEMAEFIRFTEEITTHREQGTLAYDREDSTTRPSFIIEYPQKDVDGSYFILKCYTVRS